MRGADLAWFLLSGTVGFLWPPPPRFRFYGFTVQGCRFVSEDA